MTRKTLKRLMVKGTMTYIAIFALILLVALPALALTASSIGTREIKDHEVRSRDLRNEAVTTDRIAPRAVRRGKIAKRAIRNEHIYNNISDSKIRYSTKTGHVSINPSAFVPETNGNAYTRHEGFYLYTTASGVQQFFAPVQLPNGAKVTKVTFETIDNHASYRVKWLLRRRAGATLQGMAAGSTTNASAVSGWQNLVTTAITSGREVVDNLNYSYYLEVEFNGNTSQVGAGRVLIEYEYSSPGS